MIRSEFRERLHQYIGGICRREVGRAMTTGGTENHVHLLLSLRADVSVSEAMRRVKTVSSKWVHDEFPRSGDFGWQEGYGAFVVGQSEVERVTCYIDGQEEHHKKVTFEEEFVSLLKECGIEYDPRYVWD